MPHLQLLLLVASSYLLSLWLLARWRRYRRRVSAQTRRELARPDLQRILGVVAGPAPGRLSPAARGELVVQLEAGDWRAAEALSQRLDPPLPPAPAALLAALIALVEAGAQVRPLARHRAAVKALRSARAAVALGSSAPYLEAIALLAYLRDELTADWRLWQSGRLLARALRASPADPLLELAQGLRFACAGEAEKAVAALARALYHSRGDRFIAGRLLAVPLVEELNPGLVAEARRVLAAAPRASA